MNREKEIEFHTINEDGQSSVIDELSEHGITEACGFTQGRTRDGFPVQIDIDDKNCFCKMDLIPAEQGGPFMNYYIKTDLNGFLFDPWGLFSEGMQGKELSGLDQPAWTFQPVTKICFDSYLRFLMTRNKAHINLAEREARSNA